MPSKRSDFSAVLQGDGNYRPGRIKTSELDVDDIESGDPTRLNPRLRQIHKLSNFPTGAGPEDLNAMKQPPFQKTSFYGTLYPNAGETGYDPPRIYRPGKVKQAAGLLGGGLMAPMDQQVGAAPGMAEQYYMGQMGETGDEEGMPLELLSMAGPQVAQGAQMVQMAKRLAQRPNQRLAQRHAAREADRARVVQALAAELEKLRMEKKGYQLQGQTKVQGLPIAIENRKGSVRKGTDSDGHEWRTKMKHPYGYIKGTKGVDGDPVDVYVGPDKEAPNAFVVHQHKDDGTGYDEDKVMLGFKTKAEAKKAYLEHYDDPKFLGPISRVSIERLKELVASKKKLVKISQASYVSLLRELADMEKAAGAITSAQQAGVLPASVATQLKRREQVRALRKAGPGIGGALGAGVGALVGLKRGNILKSTLTGLGTGATLGWIPDMGLSAKEAITRYRRKV